MRENSFVFNYMFAGPQFNIYEIKLRDKKQHGKNVNTRHTKSWIRCITWTVMLMSMSIKKQLRCTMHIRNSIFDKTSFRGGIL